jgi:hypothetical protein
VAGLELGFCFHGELNDFLPRARRNNEFHHQAGVTDTVKHVIESLGVPHTEIGSVTANDAPLSLSSRVADGDRIDVFPRRLPIVLADPRFVLDGHLGRLAAYLRMLGFDTWYDRFADDPALAAISSSQHRLLLTRDVGLLKRSEVTAGYCVRAHKPQDQLREVSSRFALHPHFAPFVRCMDCNGDLHSVSKEEVAELLPPHTRETKSEFSRCSACQKIFWPGSHHARMLGWIKDLTASC